MLRESQQQLRTTLSDLNLQLSTGLRSYENYYISFSNSQDTKDFNTLPLDEDDAVYQYILSMQHIIDTGIKQNPDLNDPDLKSSAYFIKMNFARVFVPMFANSQRLMRSDLENSHTSNYQLIFWISTVGLPLGLVLALLSIPLISSIFERMNTPLKLLTELKKQDVQTILKQLGDYRKLHFPILLAYRKRSGAHQDRDADDVEEFEESEDGEEGLRVSTNLSRYGSIKMMKSLTNMKIKDLLQIQTSGMGSTKEQQLIRESLKSLKTMRTKRIMAGAGRQVKAEHALKRSVVVPKTSSKYLVAQELHMQQELLAAADSYRLSQQANMRRTNHIEPQTHSDESKKMKPALSLRYGGILAEEGGKLTTPMVMVEEADMLAGEGVSPDQPTGKGQAIQRGQTQKQVKQAKQEKQTGGREQGEEGEEDQPAEEQQRQQEPPNRVKGYLLQVLVGSMVFFPWILVNLGYQYSYLQDVLPIYDHALLGTQLSEKIHNLYGYAWESVLDRKLLQISGKLRTLLGVYMTAKGRDEIDQIIRSLSSTQVSALPQSSYQQYLTWYESILTEFVCISPAKYGLSQPGEDTNCETIYPTSVKHVPIFGTQTIQNDTNSLGNLRMLIFRCADLIAAVEGSLSEMNTPVALLIDSPLVRNISLSNLSPLTSRTTRGTPVH